MTPRYELFLEALAKSSSLVTWIAVFAAMALTAYVSLEWTAPAIRPVAKRAFEFCSLFIFVLVVILQLRAMYVP